MKQVLFYDKTSKRGCYTVKAAGHVIPAATIDEPWIEIPLDMVIDNPRDFKVVDNEAVKDVLITSDMVNIERDRRIDVGFTWGGYNWQFDAATKENITGSGSLAAMAIMQGAAVGDYTWNGDPVPFQWITADNQRVSLDAHDMFAMAQAASNHVKHHIFKARDLKDTEGGPPQDYKSDSYWP